MKRFPAFRQILPVVLAAFLLTSCGKKPPPDPRLELPPGEKVSVMTELSRPTIHLGEDARLTITVLHRDDVKVTFPDEEKKIGELTVVRRGGTGPSRVSEGVVKETLWYELSSDIPDQYIVPRIRIACADIKGESEYLSGTVRLKVVRTVDDISAVKGLRDIKRPVSMRKNYGRLFALIGVLLALLVLAEIVCIVIRRHRRLRAAEEEPVPANIKALEELRRIEGLDLLEKKQYEEYAVLVSSVVRGYIRERFSVPTAEMTTEEFTQRADKGYYLTEECQTIAREFFQQSDEVKFAAHSPTEEECAALVEKAVAFIEKSC